MVGHTLGYAELMIDNLLRDCPDEFLRRQLLHKRGELMSLPKQQVSLIDYLLHECNAGKTEFRVVAESFGRIAGVKIYIHPHGKDGESRTFIVREHGVKDVTQFLPEPVNSDGHE